MITYVEKVKFRCWRHEEAATQNEIKAKHQNQSEARITFA